MALPPSWPTRSISTNPGTASFHSAQVRIGIESFNNDPGLVCEWPLTSSFARSAASRRSIVAGDIASNAISVSSLITSSSKRRNVGTNSDMIGASRLPVGAPSTAQQNASAAITSGP